MKKLISMFLCLAAVLTLMVGMGPFALAADDFETVTAVDNEACAVTIKSIDPDNLWGYTLKVLLENRSAETSYMFAVESAFINGVECDPFFAREVAPGKKSNEDISFKLDTLGENGVGEPTDIEIVFRVSDSDDWSADPVAYETVHVYPLGEDKAEAFVRQAKDTDTVLADNDDISVIVTGYEPDSIFGYAVKLFLANKTDRPLVFSVDGASVNGFMIEPYYGHELAPGKCCFGEMSWSASSLEENDIETVEDIEFTLHVRDSEDWMADAIFDEVLTLTP